jgi:hypothetical protein
MLAHVGLMTLAFHDLSTTQSIFSRAISTNDQQRTSMGSASKTNPHNSKRMHSFGYAERTGFNGVLVWGLGRGI